jgi:hypothetical protein
MLRRQLVRERPQELGLPTLTYSEMQHRRTNGVLCYDTCSRPAGPPSCTLELRLRINAVVPLSF